MQTKKVGMAKRIILSIIVFVVSVIVSLPVWFGSLLPYNVIFLLIVAGMIATGLLAYSTEIDNRNELHRKIKQKTKRLNREKRKFAELFIRYQLRELIDGPGFIYAVVICVAAGPDFK